AIVGIVAPLIGASALTTVGPRATFAIACGVQALGTIPLFAIPPLSVPRVAPGALRAAVPGFGMFMAAGWCAVTYMLVWQMALFLSLAQSYSAFGGAMALAALVGAVSGMLLGRHVDAGHGRRGVAIAFSAISLVIAGRAFSLGTPWLAV